MQERDDNKSDTSPDTANGLRDIDIDLALLFMTDLHIGSKRLYSHKSSKPLWLRCDIDGEMIDRSYLSPLSWRAIMLFEMQAGKSVIIHEMDWPGRYRRLFPKTLLRRLQWHARPNANFPPVARLYDPGGKSVMLLTRSRLCGHAVDVLHNLSDGGPVFQPLWVSDIMALRPMFGIDLVRDEAFAPTLPISAYLEAAGTKGRIVGEQEIAGMPLTGIIPRLAMPPASKAVQSVFAQACGVNPLLEKLSRRTIYGDYAAKVRAYDNYPLPA